MKRFYLFLIAMVSLQIACSLSGDKNQPVKLNEIKIIGSHNSYKQLIDPALWQLMYQQDSLSAIQLDYAHLPILQQLDLGLRGLELDVNYDPDGGRYAHPAGLAILEQNGSEFSPYDPENKLSLPGLKIFHVQDLDFRSDYLLFKDALTALKQWSLKNENHIPVIITMNAKDEELEDPQFIKPLKFDKTALETIDKEIGQVFDDAQLVTPDFVRGNAGSLHEAIMTKGWPALEKVRGRFMFVLDEGDEKLQNYIAGHPGLKGRKMFVLADAGTPESGFIILNDPKESLNEIKQLVANGYIVRTRADADTKEARENDYSRFEAAQESGAQMISTDYYVADLKLGTGYKISFNTGNPFVKIPQ